MISLITGIISINLLIAYPTGSQLIVSTWANVTPSIPKYLLIIGAAQSASFKIITIVIAEAIIARTKEPVL